MAKNRKGSISILTIALFFITLSASKCDKPLVERFYPITVLNNSSDTIYADLGLGEKRLFAQYPDTVIPTNKPVLMFIPPYNSSSHFDFRKPQEQVVEELNADTLSIYIFSRSAYQDTSWEKVRNGYQVLKRYDLSIKDLKKLDWKVIYPPDPEMRSIKQFPPF